MSFPNTEPYVYGTSSEIQDMVVSSSIVPSIEMVSAPVAVTNSLQATFVVRVYDATLAMTLVSANLFYKLDGAGTYTPLGTARQVSFPVTAGAHEIIFTAELDGEYSTPMQFSWTVDTIRPAIVNIQPVDGTNQVNINPLISVEFSENMDSSSTIAALSFTPNIAGTWSGSGNIFTFVLDNDLAYEQTYLLEIANTAEDLAGNTILSAGAAQFSTIEETNQLPNPPNFNGLFVPTSTSSKNIIIPFNVPTDSDDDALHFVAEIATNNTFTSGLTTYNTINNPIMFTYYDGSGNKVGSFPGMGVSPGTGKVVFNPNLELTNGQYWVRFFTDDRR